MQQTKMCSIILARLDLATATFEQNNQPFQIQKMYLEINALFITVKARVFRDGPESRNNLKRGAKSLFLLEYVSLAQLSQRFQSVLVLHDW